MNLGIEVDFLAVGEGSQSGDAIAIRFGDLYSDRDDDQRVVVIDGGHKKDGESVINLIQEYYGTSTVDLMISTHPDADHIGGLCEVIQQLDVKALWMHLPWKHSALERCVAKGRVVEGYFRTRIQNSVQQAHTLDELAAERGVEIVEPFAGQAAFADLGVSLRVLGPSEDFYEKLLPRFREPKSKSSRFVASAQAALEHVKKKVDSWGVETLTDSGSTSAENDSSAITMMSCRGWHWLFTGDAGIPALTRALGVLDGEDFDFSQLRFFQVPHHGSVKNVGPTILNTVIGARVGEGEVVEPSKDACISAATGGAPKHPNQRVVNALHRRGVKAVFGTARSGNFRWWLNGPQRPRYSPTQSSHEFREIVVDDQE